MIPALFIHHGPSSYLPYTLRTFALSNPGRPIIFLGNETNEKLVRPHAQFFNFRSLVASPERVHFEKVFRPIVGSAHGKEDWVKFVFLRFFYLYEYWTSCKEHGLDQALWTFDSDTLVLEDLGELEPILTSYDCTEQCNGMCMGGMIRSPIVLQSFLETILTLFESPHFLAEEEERLRIETQHAFTEMRAYEEWKRGGDKHTFHLGKELAGGIFDDCLCQSHGMEMYTAEEAGRPCKKLYYHSSGHLYCRRQEDASFLLMRSLNVSWLPLHIFTKIFRTLEKTLYRSPPPLHPSKEKLSVLSLRMNYGDAVSFHYERIRNFFRPKLKWP